MNIIGRKWFFLSASGVLVFASIAAILAFGFKPGIDFVGGTLWQVSVEDDSVARDDFSAFFRDELGIAEVVVTEGDLFLDGQATDASFLIRFREISEADHQAYLGRLREQWSTLQELSFQTIGGAVGREVRNRAITAIMFVLVGISLYIAFAFRKVSRPVSSWKYGVITLLTLFHDALIPAGLTAIFGRYFNVEADINFIVALLVVMGFSVHDTIVVFDRIRENLRISGSGGDSFEDLVNRSVNQTMARSINTSLTLILVLIALYFFGAPALRHFVLVIAVGTIVGTYSSIFVASPLLTLWKKRE